MFQNLAQTYSSSSAASAAGNVTVILMSMLFVCAIALIAIVGMWKVFTKAGQPGWASIVPFYNTYVMVKIAGRPAWWFLLYFIPFVSIVITLLVSMDVAKKFGKSELFGVVGLWFFSFIGYLILGFGSAVYQSDVNGPIAPDAYAAGSVAPVVPSVPTPPTDPTPPVAPQV